MVLISKFNQEPQNSEAKAVFEAASPGKNVIQIDSSEIIKRSGALHCIVQHVYDCASSDDQAKAVLVLIRFVVMASNAQLRNLRNALLSKRYTLTIREYRYRFQKGNESNSFGPVCKELPMSLKEAMKHYLL